MFLEVKNLTVELNNKLILNNIYFSCNKADIVIILGESGQGKTTFLKTLNGLISPVKGEIYFKNKNIFEYNPLILRKKICYIPQIPISITDKVINELKLIKKDLSKEFISEYFKKFKLDLDILEYNMSDLSVGQQQRIAILRGILNNPEIMLLDEPTSSLDNENIFLLEEIIETLNKNKKMTFIIATHNLSFSKKLSKIKYLISNGEMNVL